MPDRIPRTAAEWAAIKANEHDAALAKSAYTAGVDEQGLAAASRVAAHERDVDKLAMHLCDGWLSARGIRLSYALMDEVGRSPWLAEARRILEE